MSGFAVIGRTTDDFNSNVHQCRKMPYIRFTITHTMCKEQHARRTNERSDLFTRSYCGVGLVGNNTELKTTTMFHIVSRSSHLTNVVTRARDCVRFIIRVCVVCNNRSNVRYTVHLENITINDNNNYTLCVRNLVGRTKPKHKTILYALAFAQITVLWRCICWLSPYNNEHMI